MGKSWRANRDDLGGRPGGHGGHGRDRRHQPRELIADTLDGVDVIAASVSQPEPKIVAGDASSDAQAQAA